MTRYAGVFPVAPYRSDTVRHPLQPLHPATRQGLLELARELNPLALTWGR